MTTWLHQERLRAVQAAIWATGASRLLDLGCGDGDLLLRLAAEPGISEIVGIDQCPAALDRLRRRLSGQKVRVPRIDLREGSLMQPDPSLAGFDCAALVETIEHLDPGHLSSLERAVFRIMRPRHVVVTTPNAEFNVLLGVPAHRFRHADHRFEWGRAKFRRWGTRTARAAGYSVRFEDVAGCHPDYGGASQMALFERLDATAKRSRETSRETS